MISNTVGIILTSEVSHDGTVLFIGGSTAFDFKRGHAIIQAVNFTKQLNYITDIQMTEADNMYVSKIRRIEESNKIIVATSKSVYIYIFKNQFFNKIAVIPNLLPGGDCMTEMVLFKSTLYVLPSNSKVILQVEFASS